MFVRRLCQTFSACGIFTISALFAASAFAQGTVTGTVRNTSNVAVQSVQVELRDSSGTQIRTGTTNASGVYTISSVAPGAYYIVAGGSAGTALVGQVVTGPGNPTLGNPNLDRAPCSACVFSSGGVVNTGGGQLQSVTSGGTVTANFFLSPGPQITGNVKKGGVGAQTTVLVLGTGGRLVAQVTSQASGNYQTHGLTPGTYYIYVANTVGFLDGVYQASAPNTTVDCVFSACDITAVGSGIAVVNSTVSGIDVNQTAGGVLAGTLKDKNNANVTGPLFLFDTSGQQLTSGFAVGGSFSITAPAGTYRLATLVSSGNLINQVYNGRDLSGSFPLPSEVLAGDNIVLTQGSTTNIAIVLKSGGSITGTIISTVGNVALSGVGVSLYLANGVTVSNSTSTNSSGVFSFAGVLPGNYYVKTTSAGSVSPGYLNKAYTPGGGAFCGTGCDLAATGTPIAAQAGQTITLNNLTLDLASSLSGTIVDASTQAPLQGITVELFESTKGSQGTQTTNASGAFSFTGLTSGTYFFKTTGAAASTGYVDSAYTAGGGVICPASCQAASVGTPIVIASNQNASGLTLPLPLGGKITGTVTAFGAGTPMQSVIVAVYEATQTSASSPIVTAVTAANGTYALQGLPAGNVTVRTTNATSKSFLDGLYKDLPCDNCSPAQGTPIAVTLGGTTPGIDFALRPGGTITGKVTNAATLAGVGSATASFYDSNGAFVTTATSSTQVATLGNYASPVLAPGTYYVLGTAIGTELLPSIYNGLTCTGCANVIKNGTPVTVTGGAVTPNINLALTPGFSISGKVTSPSNTGISFMLVYVISSQGNFFFALTDGAGNYTVPGLPAGTYYVQTAGAFPPVPFVDQAYKPGGGVTGVPCPNCSSLEVGTPIVVSGPVTGINMTLAAGATISGAVTANSNPVPSASVTVFDAASGSYVTATSTDSSGTYSLPNLPAGSFVVTARPPSGSNRLPQVYNGKITLSVGQIQTGINFNLTAGGTITGVVRSSAPGNPPLAGISVIANGASGASGSASTNASGVYTITGLPADTYSLYTSNSSGFLNALYDGLSCSPCNSTVGTPVPLNVGETRTANFTLTPGGRISGTVVDAATGQPIKGISVSFITAAQPGTTLASVSTGDSGAFAAIGLPPGTYLAKTTSAAGKDYVDKLYDDIVCPSCVGTGGTPIVLPAGVDVTNVNFALSRAGRVSGVVKSSSNSPIEGAAVYIYGAVPDGSGSAAFLGSATTASNGAYIVTGLPPGDVVAVTANTLGYVDEVYDDVPCLNCLPSTLGKPFGVAAGATTSGIDFTLDVGARIRGTLLSSAPGNPPVTLAQVRVYSDKGDALLSYINTGAAGTYTIPAALPPGRYYVKAVPTGYQAQVYDGIACRSCAASTGTPIDLTAGQIFTANFTFAPGATISGTITEGAASNGSATSAVGGPIAGVTVTVFDSGGAQIGDALTAADGTYAIAGLSAGNYFLRTTNTGGFLDEMYDNVACQACSDFGTPVTVGATGTVSGIDFTLTRGGTIAGSVTDLANVPLGSITMDLYGSTGKSIRSLGTNGLGAYSFTGLAAGTYYMKTRNTRGYVDEVFSDIACVGCDPASGFPITLASASSNVTDVNFALAVGGQITGKVLGSGVPLEGVAVQVYSPDGTLAATVLSTAKGTYQAVGLAGGTYFVRTAGSRSFVDQVFNGQTCLGCNTSQGTPIPVNPGLTTPNVNFNLLPGGRMSGVVTSGGQPVSNVAVGVYDANNVLIVNGTTDATGTFVTPANLPSGGYYAKTTNNLGLIDEIYDDIFCPGCNAVTGKPFAVTAGQTTTGINFALDAGSRIAGTITDKSTGLPVSSVLILAFTAAGEQVGFGTTSSSGRYITNAALKAGTYYLRTSSGNGYISKLYNDVECVACPAANGTPVTVGINEVKTGIDIALTKGGRIAGQVVDAATGDPIAAPSVGGTVSVEIYNANNQKVATVYLDISGRFLTGVGLPTGTYYARTLNTLGYIDRLYGSSTPCLGDSGNGRLPIGGGPGAPACLPNTGTPIAVTAGQTTTGINLALFRGLRIGGVVTAAGSGTPIGSAVVNVYDTAGRKVAGGSSNSSGRWLTGAALPTGTYFASADALEQGYYRKLYVDTTCPGCSPTTGTPIDAQATKTDVNFTLAKGGALSGTVKAAAGSTPIGNLPLTVYTASGTSLRTATTDASGAFAANALPPGSYFLRTFNARGYVDQAWQGKTCAPCPLANATPITVVANKATSGLDFLLDQGGLVSGYIVDANGLPLVGVAVSFFTTGGTFVGKSGVTDANGYFAISLPVGTYNASVSGVAGYKVLSSVSSGATTSGQISTVTVTSGGAAGLSVTLAPCAAPAVSPGSLGVMTIGSLFSTTISASGGSAPYTFAVADGSLPPGLTLNAGSGVLSGTPMSRGTATFTIAATDSGDCSGSTEYSLITRGVTLDQSSVSVSKDANGGTLVVTADAAGIAWTASSNSSWLTINTAAGTGNGSIGYTIAANTGTARTGTITVAGETFTVFQARFNRPRIALDAPTNGQVVPRNFTVAGWALDLDASDVGVDAVHVYAFPLVNGVPGAGIFLGAASAASRPDVAAAFGGQFLSSGYLLEASSLPIGPYRLSVFARTSLTGLFEAQQTVDVTVAVPGAAPAMALDGPAFNATVGQRFVVAGWAVDRGATAGTGVDAVQVWAYPVTASGFGAATFLGAAGYGSTRADVGTVFGSQFTNSGFYLDATGLAPGLYRIVVYARSTVTGSVNQTAYADVTSNAPVPNPAMSIDGPPDNSTRSQPFVIGGWAVDPGSTSGPGVDVVHVWAFNVATGSSTFVGAAPYGGTRADVGAVYGAQFANSGYSLSASGLPPGTYNVGVYMHSTVTGTFSLAKFVRVTIQ